MDVNLTTLKKALSTLDFHPDTNLLASRLNNHFEKCCSLRPGPGATIIDAFTFSWLDIHFYCFPPFSCILHILQKSQQEERQGVLVVRDWPTPSMVPHPDDTVESSTSSPGECLQKINMTLISVVGLNSVRQTQMTPLDYR